jgi:threonine-phosphate decarboxylase
MSICHLFTGRYKGRANHNMIEGHGDDAYRYKNPIRADFSSNVLYGPVDAGLKAHLQEQVATVTHYPEASAQSLQAVAAEVYAVASDQVLVTNGVTEAIYLAAQAFRRLKTATILTPAFAEYEDACRLHELDIHWLSWDSLTPDNRLPGGLVFLCQPNNPTGAALPPAHLHRLLRGHPDAVFVVDESYIEFTQATTSLLPRMLMPHVVLPHVAPHPGDYPNVLVLRSLTKSCRIPGLRIGFAIGHSSLISRLRECKMPWSVNRLAIEAGLYIFGHGQQFRPPLEQLLADTAAWREELQSATGWQVYDTDTHYFLVETPAAFTAAALKEHLITRHGLLIRDASNFRGLTPYHFRVACQSSEHNRLLTEALRECSRTGI